MKTFNLKVQNGQLTFTSDTHKALFQQFVKDSEGKILQVTRYQPVRSNQQSRFYWVYLGIISAETGDEPVALHEYFKRAHLPPKFIKAMGKETRVPASTTDLSTTEFSEYLDRICAETAIPIPDPKALESQGYIPNDKPIHS